MSAFFEEVVEGLLGEFESGGVVIWVEADDVCCENILMDEEFDLLLAVVEDAKGRNGAGCDFEFFVKLVVFAEGEFAGGLGSLAEVFKVEAFCVRNNDKK